MAMRGWLEMGAIVLTSAGLAVTSSGVRAADEPAQALAQAASARGVGRLSEAEMGNLIRAMGIDVKLENRRYDFSFEAIYNKEKWNLSMSAVLSENGNSIWVLAWLDQCPKSAAEVPRTALLRLLAKNDTLGNGKFFAYIPSNNRFVLQRVIPNDQVTTARFREVLQDLGASVVETYPHWSVTNWKQPTEHAHAAEASTDSRAKWTQPPSETQRTSAQVPQRPAYRSQN